MTKLPAIAEILPGFIAAVLLYGIGRSLARAWKNKGKKSQAQKLGIVILTLLLALCWWPLSKIILVVLTALGSVFV
jgi:hypothetical protein